MEETSVKKVRTGKILLIIGIIISSLFTFAITSFVSYKLLIDVVTTLNSGGTERYYAKAIGTIAYKEEKSITIKKHQFTYYNVKSSKDGGWVLLDHTSYIVNTDIQFGFRYKNADLVMISIYGDSVNIPSQMEDSDQYPGYTNYQVYNGFKLAIKESVQPGEGIDIGVLMHWC